MGNTAFVKVSQEAQVQGGGGACARLNTAWGGAEGVATSI